MRISRWLTCTLGAVVLVSCAEPSPPGPQPDPDIAELVGRIRAVDNHSHPSSTAPGDADTDALPLDGIAPFELPARMQTEHPQWMAALKGLFGYKYNDLSEAHLNELRAAIQSTHDAQGDKFPLWVLDRIHTDVLLANRIALGPGLVSPRVRWVPFADPLLYPLSTKNEAMVTPDREKLFPLEDKLLRRYLADLHVAKLPDTLDAYVKTVVTPTLESQKTAGAVALKFEAAYLRALDFADAPAATAAGVYARYIKGGDPSRTDYKALQDYLFRFIAREAGRLGLAVHVHSFEGAGNFYGIAGSDPLLLEPVFDDPSLRKTNFVIVHGGGVFSNHAGALLWKPNVFVDTSLMSLAYSPAQLADTLRNWLRAFPQKVLYGSDATALTADAGWEVVAWAASRNVRDALTLALTDMINNGELTRPQAAVTARMVLRMNASRLYGLNLK
jgi:hypothetical protein